MSEGVAGMDGTNRGAQALEGQRKKDPERDLREIGSTLPYICL